MIHEVAEWDPDREQELFDWPLRDLMQKAVEQRKAEASRLHHEAWVRWALLAAVNGKKAGKSPDLPEILKD